MVNCTPNKYMQKCFGAYTMARHSFSTTEYFFSAGDNWRLANATGCSFPFYDWLSTAPKPKSEASVWRMNCLLGSATCNTGVLIICFLRRSKAISHSLVQITLSGLPPGLQLHWQNSVQIFSSNLSDPETI